MDITKRQHMCKKAISHLDTLIVNLKNEQDDQEETKEGDIKRFI